MQESRSVPDNEVHGLVVPRARTRPDRPQVRRLPVGLLPIAKAAAPQLAEEITVRIREEIAAFAGERRRRLHRLVHEAVVVAVDAFVRLSAGDYDAYARVDEHFHALGRVEAVSGTSVGPVVAAIRLADGSVWQTIRSVALHKDVEALVVADLGVDVNAYLRYLEAQVQLGFAVGSAVALDPGSRLLRALLLARPSAEIAALANATGRELSEQVVVLTAQRYGASPAGLVLSEGTLASANGDRTVVVADLDHVEPSRRALLGLGPRVVIAEAWPVELQQAGDAYRWTYRALALVNEGRLRPEGRIVDCWQHRMTLLLEADPALVDSMASELLEPLFAEKTHQRLVLAETLLLSLETDEPARVLGERLGTCAQTVRNRIQRLERMFGDRLADPNQRMMLILVLNAVLPRWRAERAPRPPRARRPRTSG